MTDKKSKTKQEKESRKNNWQIFCDSYLNIARLACLEIINKKYKPSNVGPYYNNSDIEKLYIPMRYNLNHAIEIFLKHLSKVLNENKIEKGHNIENLLEDFKKSYKVEEIKNVTKERYQEILEMKDLLRNADKSEEVKRYLELNKKYKREVVERTSLAELELEDLNDYFDKAIKICYKYFSWKDLEKHILSSSSIKDIQNMGFRYPEDNGLSIEVDYEIILKEIRKEEEKIIRNILNDINELERYFNSMAFLINTAKEE